MPNRFNFAIVMVVFFLVAYINMNLADNLEEQAGEGQEQGQALLESAQAPRQLGEFTLVSLVAGQEAVDSISQLHRVSIELVDGLVAEYAAGSAGFILWLSDSKDAAGAEELFRLMDEKMPANPIFKNRRPVELAGNIYIYVTGGGMENYYWVDGVRNYWVGIQSGEHEEILQLVRENF